MRKILYAFIGIIALTACDDFKTSPLVGHYEWGTFKAHITQPNENTLRLTVEFINDYFNYTNSGTFDAKPIHGTYQGFFAYVYTDSCGVKVKMGELEYGGDHIDYVDYRMDDNGPIGFTAQKVD